MAVKMRRFRLVIVIGMLTCASVLFPTSLSEASKETQALSLDDFISETIRMNPAVRGYVQEHAEAKGQEYASRGIDDVNLESLFSLMKRENPQLSGIATDEDKQIGYGIGLKKIVSESGTRLGVGYSNAWTKSQYPTIITGLVTPLNPVYTPSVTLSLTQPLLKNWLGRQDQLGKRLSKIGLRLAAVSVQENIESFISEMTQLYLNWLQAYNDSKILEQVYHRVGEEVRLVKEQVEAKVAEKSDLYRILEQQANYKALWEGALAHYEGTTRQVAAMMRPDAPPQDIHPQSTKGTFLEQYRLRTHGVQYLKDQSRLSQILALTAQSEEETLLANKNAKLPDLNLFVDYSRTGASGSFSQAHGSAFDYDDISGGVALSVPITNRTSRGEYRAQEAKVARVGYQNEKTMLDATSQLEAFYDQERRLVNQVQAYEDQVTYGRKKLDEEYDQYNDGRLSLFQLLQDYTTWINQSLNLERARVNLAQVRLLIGELTDVNLQAFQGVIDEVVGAEKP